MYTYDSCAKMLKSYILKCNTFDEHCTIDNYNLFSLLSKCFMLIDHYTILFDNVFDKYNS